MTVLKRTKLTNVRGVRFSKQEKKSLSQWRLMGIWKEPTLIESLVCREIVTPRFKSAFSFAPSEYIHLNHNQLLPRLEYEKNVLGIAKLFLSDPAGTTKILKKSVWQSIVYLEKFRLTTTDQENLSRLLELTARMARHWYEIMISDGALQQVYPQSLPDSFVLAGKKFTPQSLLADVALPKKIFPMVSEHYDLLKMAIKAKSNRSFAADLKRHVRKYSWMNSLCWWDEPFTEVYYENQVRQYAKKNPALLLKEESISRKHQYDKANMLLRELKKLYPLAYQYIDAIRELAGLKEDNWDVVSLTGVRMRPFFKELASRHGFSINQLLMCTSDELLLMYSGKEVVDVHVLNQRLARVGVYARRGHSVKVFHDKKVDLLLRKYIGKAKKTNALTGTIIWQGKVRGRVSILKNVDEVHAMKPGNILVCPMTDPDYMPAIRQARAIVTNQGGLLCHAAIVARELRIPCIVGTEIATRIFKNGDMVEVDAIRGIVKKI